MSQGYLQRTHILQYLINQSFQEFMKAFLNGKKELNPEMSYQQKMRYLEQQFAPSYIRSFIRNGIRYNYQKDPDQFVKQRRLQFQQKAIKREKMKKERQTTNNKSCKVSQVFNKFCLLKNHTLLNYNEIKQGKEQIQSLQLKCQQIQCQVINLMKTKKSQSMEVKEQQNEEIQVLSCESSDQFIKDKKIKGNIFFFEGVKMNFQQDPNRFKKYWRKRDILLKRRAYQIKKGGKNVQQQQKKQVKINPSEVKCQQIQQLKEELKNFQCYKTNLKVELRRLQKKRSLLLEQIQKLREKNLEERGNQIQVNNVKGKQIKKLTFCRCYFLNIGRTFIPHIEIVERPNECKQNNAKAVSNVKSFSILSVFLITIRMEYFYIYNSEGILIFENKDDGEQKLLQATFEPPQYPQVVKQEQGQLCYYVKEKAKYPIEVSDEEYSPSKRKKQGSLSEIKEEEKDVC